MTDQESVYNNPKRQRELIGMLEKRLQSKFETANALDKKAWDILGVGSATLGVVSVLQIVGIDDLTALFWVGLVVVLLTYLLLVYEVLGVIAPMVWSGVPEPLEWSPDQWNEFLDKYMIPEDRDYLYTLFMDYLGSRQKRGALQIAEDNNREKAKHIRRASRTLGALIVGLIVMAILASI